MRKIAIFLAAIAAILAFQGPASAQTNCDSQAKPAFDCPTGYSVMCIPTGGDHWGCGRENAVGGVDETNPVNEPAAARPTTAEPVATAPQTTPTASLAQTAPPPTNPTPTQAAPTAAPAAPAPLEAPAAPSPEPASLEDVQETIEDVAEYAPASLQPVLEAIVGTLGVIVAFLGLWEWLKRMREKKTGKCDRCGETKEKEKCARCDGTGKIEQEYEMTVKCSHCKGSGTDPCHHCGGTGKMSGPNPIETEQELEGLPPCDFCGGSGQKRIGAGRDWGEANDAVKNGQFACCFCKGKKEETAKLKREIDCPDCKGRGTK